MNSYGFILHRFQNIMDIACPESSWPLRERGLQIKKYCEEYKHQFNLINYRNTELWRIIRKKFDLWFDDLLWDQQMWEKDRNYISPREGNIKLVKQPNNMGKHKAKKEKNIVIVLQPITAEERTNTVYDLLEDRLNQVGPLTMDEALEIIGQKDTNVRLSFNEIMLGMISQRKARMITPGHYEILKPDKVKSYAKEKTPTND